MCILEKSNEIMALLMGGMRGTLYMYLLISSLPCRLFLNNATELCPLYIHVYIYKRYIYFYIYYILYLYNYKFKLKHFKILLLVSIYKIIIKLNSIKANNFLFAPLNTARLQGKQTMGMEVNM